MSDPLSMSLDDIIKSRKKTGKPSFARGGRGGGRGQIRPSGRNNANNGGGVKRGGQNSYRGRQRQPVNNVQQRRGNRGYGGGGRNRQQQFVAAGPSTSRGNQRFRGGRGGGGGGQGLNRRLSAVQKRNNNSNRQMRRQRGIGRGSVGQGLSRQQATSNQRYFNSPTRRGAGKPNRNIGQRVRPQKLNISAHVLAQRSLLASKNSKRAVMKLAKKRVQRAKLLVSKKKATVVAVAGAGKIKKLMENSGRVALGRNGFVTVRNTKAKRMERALVQMKIARAQQARNKVSPQPQRTVNLPGSSGMRNRSRKPRNVMAAPTRGVDWNTSIVRTMRNDLVDVMTSSQLDPEIQQKIAFIQSRSKNERAPVMPDFKAPVTTSRMKLSDRFRLLRDQ